MRPVEILFTFGESVFVRGVVFVTSLGVTGVLLTFGVSTVLTVVLVLVTSLGVRGVILGFGVSVVLTLVLVLVASLGVTGILLVF